MIDWLTLRVPCWHAKGVFGGRLVALSNTGEVEWETLRRKTVEGSYSSTVQVRSDGNEKLWISGNPSKFLQGHNLFGSNDLQALGLTFIERVLETLTLRRSPFDRLQWQRGEYECLRVDIAESFRLPRPADVDTWIRAASEVVRGKHQSVSAYAGETIYIGQESRRIALKAYNKAKELRKHPLPEKIEQRARLLEFADGLLRVEVRLLAQELKRRELNYAYSWTESVCTHVLRERIERLEMPQKMRLTSEELEDLPSRLVAIAKLWESGADLRSLYPRRTFYRYRKELRQKGIDIAAPSPRKEMADVIPLLQVLEARQVVAPPTWALGTPLLACA